MFESIRLCKHAWLWPKPWILGNCLCSIFQRLRQFAFTFSSGQWQQVLCNRDNINLKSMSRDFIWIWIIYHCIKTKLSLFQTNLLWINCLCKQLRVYYNNWTIENNSYSPAEVKTSKSLKSMDFYFIRHFSWHSYYFPFGVCVFFSDFKRIFSFIGHCLSQNLRTVGERVNSLCMWFYCSVLCSVKILFARFVASFTSCEERCEKKKSYASGTIKKAAKESNEIDNSIASIKLSSSYFFGLCRTLEMFFCMLNAFLLFFYV